MNLSKLNKDKSKLRVQACPCEDNAKKRPCCNDTGHNECNSGQCICDLIESTALVETALSHILNAEGEKIQKAVAISNNINDLLEVNRSVNKTISNVIQLEQVLYQQFSEVNDLCRVNGLECCKFEKPGIPKCPCENPEPCKPCVPECPCKEPEPCKPCVPECPCKEPEPCKPCIPECPCKEPEPCKPCVPDCPCEEPKPSVRCPSECPCSEQKPCTSIFTAATEYVWTGGTTMYLLQESDCSNGVNICCKRYDSLILLPPGKKFKIEYDIELMNKHLNPVSIEMNLCCGKESLQKRNISISTGKCSFKDNNSFVWQTPQCDKNSTFSIWLISSSNLKIINGKIFITEVK